MTNRMMFSLDIGSSKIVAMAGAVEDETVEVHGVSSYHFMNNSQKNDFLSVSNGVVCDLEMVSSKVAQVLNEARISADCGAGGVIVNVSGANVCNRYSKTLLELNYQTITADTIRQLLQGIKQVDLSSGHEMLDYEVQEYQMDGSHYALNPIHLTANVIESNINLFLAGSSQVSNLRNILRYSGYSLAKLVPSGILSGMAVLNHEEKQLGCCLLDIGAGTTDVVVYENGFIRHLCSIPMAGESITKDIASVLKISRNLAEDIKLTYGGTSYATTGTALGKFSEGVVITDHRGVNTNISRKLLIDVINERLKDIFDVVQSVLNKYDIYDIISSGIVLTGGTALLPHLEDFAGQYFNVPVRLGLPEYSGEFADLLVTPRYATCFGALRFAKTYMLNEVGSYAVGGDSKFKQLLTKCKNIFV